MESKGSKFLESSNWTRVNKDEEGKSEDSIGLANSQDG